MDVIILGAGIVGLTITNLLAQDTNLKIALIESKPLDFSWNTSEYDLRCSAITRATQNVFKHLGVWPDIIAVRVGIYEYMQVWDKQANSLINFAATEISDTDLGHIIENRVIQQALWNKIKNLSNVNIIYGVADKLEQQIEFNRLYIGDEYIDCKLIIGADGANSWLRNAVNISTYDLDYNQSSLVATIKSQLPHNRTAMQCFAADGSLAFLPLDESNLSSIVWSSTPEKIEYLIRCSDLDFCNRLAADFDYKLGNLELHGKRACFPLRMLHAKNYITERIALIGDAAHVIHPLAGQGMNLGIMDAAALSEIINQACINNKDIGKISVLRKYERWRKGHNLSVIAIADGFKRVFDSQYGLFQYLRGYGMRLTNDFSFGKRMMIRFAMGLTGDLPAIAKCY